MKRYLDLVPISARVHGKQNRMSIFCIILAVFLVTAIFGMADMFVRSQILQTKQEYGDWHIFLKDIGWEDAAVIAARPDVAAASPYGVLNYRGDLGYTLGGKHVAICGSDESYISGICAGELKEGAFPQTQKEALVTENAREDLGLHIGDPITIKTPEKTELTFTVSGFLKNAASIMSGDFYGVFLRTEDYCAVYPGITEGEPADYGIGFFVQFASTVNIQRDIARLKAQCGLTEEQIAKNNKLLGLLGQSRDSFMMQIYTAAAVLCVLVLSAGIMMIAGSLHSNVAQRTEFFGLMRCIGATPKQVMRLVHKEALGWCRFAIPAGIAAGAVVIWILCAVLRFLSPEYFAAMPVFGLSVPSMAAGVVVGLLTVILAARAPAKKAAGVSPLAAASGNADSLPPVRKAANTKFFRIEAVLGMYHAKARRKNLVLMTGSFAFSIILFLSFSVTVVFMQHSLTPLYPWTADLSIISPDYTCSVDRAFLNRLQENPAVDAAYGRMFAYDVPMTGAGTQGRIDLISYEQRQFDWARDYLLEGSVETVQEEAGTGLLVYEPRNTLRVGDRVTVDVNGHSEEIRIAGILSTCPFDHGAGIGTIICSEDTFRRLTGETDYTIIDIQLTKGAGDEEAAAIRQMAGPAFTFSDERMGNSSTRGIYYSVWLFIYGFLVLIAFITVFNVVNSIAMSVAARTKQYGAFRAIGLSIRQLTVMILAEAFTYAAAGSVVGTVLGLLCNRVLFGMLVSYRWGDPWKVPWTELGLIVLLVMGSVVLAVYGPVRRIRDMSVVDTISAQ